MSASTEKKIRAQARLDGTDKKAIKAAEEAKKNAKTRKKYTIAIIATVIFIALTIFLNSNLLVRGTTALTVGDEKYSPAEANYAYATEFYNYANQYGSYAQYMGLDLSSGIQNLGSQECAILEEGGTWRDYFKESSLNALKEISGLSKYARDNGMELDAEEIATVDASFEGLDDVARENNLKNGDAYLSRVYGRGVNEQVVRGYELKRALASKAYYSLLDDAAAADTSFEDYDMVNVRHILVKAEASEDGTYSVLAMNEAKAKAEKILAEFEAGDKTEDSFAALAEEHSEDSGSNTSGGLYEDVYKGEMVVPFNDWCFDSSRKDGDTGIVEVTSDYYAGYHIMYFCGNGNKYSESSARASELASMIQDKINEIKDAQEVNTTIFYKLVGKN